MIKKIYNLLYEFLYREYYIHSYYISVARLNIKNAFILFSVVIFCTILCLFIGTNIYKHINKKDVSGRGFLRLSFFAFFICLSFFINLVINYGELYPGMSIIRPMSMTLGEISFEFGGGTFNRVYKEEWLRGIVEIISYIPLGVSLYKIIKKNSMIVTTVVCALISVFTELLCNAMKVSAFYYVTLCNNLIGALIGIGFVELVKRIILKEKKKIKCILVQLPLILAFLVYGISYLVYFRHDFGNIYPQYYKAIERNKINVSMSDDVELSGYEWTPNGDMSFSVDELRKYAEYYFSMYGKEIDDEKTVIDRHEQYDIIEWTDKEELLYFEAYKGGFSFSVLDGLERSEGISPLEIPNILKDYGINFEVDESKIYVQPEATHSIMNWNHFSDGIYSFDSVFAVLNEENRVSWITCSRYFFVDIKVICEDEYNNVYYVGNPEKYYEIVSPQQAYDKLCAGEGYAEGLVEAADKGKLDIHVTDYHVEVHRDDLDCLQYVYCFDVEPIEVEGQAPITKIYVPAMKINY